MADASIPVPGSVGEAVDITPPGEFNGTWLEYLHSWIVTVDHKRIGILYIGLGLFFLLVAGI
jgi:cytochrome c oxidase subunit 1